MKTQVRTCVGPMDSLFSLTDRIAAGWPMKGSGKVISGRTLRLSEHFTPFLCNETGVLRYFLEV